MIVPSKNIALVLHDVKPPAGFVQRLAPHKFSGEPAPSESRLKVNMVTAAIVPVVFDVNRKPTPEPRNTVVLTSYAVKQESLAKPQARVSFLRGTGKRRSRKKLLIAAVVLMFALTAYGWHLFRVKNQVVAAVSLIKSELTASLEDLKSLRPGDAEDSLRSVSAEMQTVDHLGRVSGVLPLGNLLSGVSPAIAGAISGFENLRALITDGVAVSGLLQELKDSGVTHFFGNGAALLKALEALQAAFQDAIQHSQNIAGLLSTMNNSGFGSYVGDAAQGVNGVALLSEAYSANDFLAELISLLKKPDGFHFAVLFQNPSEIRPSGGFLGSYADLFIKQGELRTIDVRDIYDPDGQLDLKTEPPAPLQSITVNWGARDANWFFDFSKSAEKVLYFLEQSKIYSERSIRFDGAIAINTNILQTILAVTGPVALTDFDLTINQNNFLIEIQKEVEDGKYTAIHQPKKILQDLTPILLERLKNLADEEKDQMLAALQAHLANKDIQFYFKDEQLENFVAKYDVSGDSYRLPEHFSGDYLAVVNTNVASGKTDILMEQHIAVASKIDISGAVHNDVTVTRKHNGADSDYSWYRTVNQDYMRLLTPPGTTLDLLSGDSDKRVYPRINYKKNGYATDVDVVLMEERGLEGGKQVLGGWLNIAAGKKKTIEFQYSHPNGAEVKDGATYTFVYDKQSGVESGLELEIDAPPGYIWLEANNPVFKYTNNVPPKRVEIDLTLKKI